MVLTGFPRWASWLADHPNLWRAPDCCYRQTICACVRIAVMLATCFVLHVFVRLRALRREHPGWNPATASSSAASLGTDFWVPSAKNQRGKEWALSESWPIGLTVVQQLFTCCRQPKSDSRTDWQAHLSQWQLSRGQVSPWE